MRYHILLSFTILAICATVFAYPADVVVKYGSGSAFVERAPTDADDCPLEPGAVCGALVAACASAIKTPATNTAQLVWKIVSCVWRLCCAGKPPNCSGSNYTGDKGVDPDAAVIEGIAGSGATTFGYDHLLGAIEAYSGKSIGGNSDYETILTSIMDRLTGSASGSATLSELTSYLTNSGTEVAFNE